MIARTGPRGHAAGVLFVLAWAFWLHRWTPLLAVVAIALWVALHAKLEAGLGDALQRRWYRVWRPGLTGLEMLTRKGEGS